MENISIWRNIVLILIVFVFVEGCGGGSKGSSVSDEKPASESAGSSEEEPQPEIMDVTIPIEFGFPSAKEELANGKVGIYFLIDETSSTTSFCPAQADNRRKVPLYFLQLFESFVQYELELTENIDVGVMSFTDGPMEENHLPLTRISELKNPSIWEDTRNYLRDQEKGLAKATKPTEALSFAGDQLLDEEKNYNKRIIVLITDGIFHDADRFKEKLIELTHAKDASERIEVLVGLLCSDDPRVKVRNDYWEDIKMAGGPTSIGIKVFKDNEVEPEIWIREILLSLNDYLPPYGYWLNGSEPDDRKKDVELLGYSKVYFYPPVYFSEVPNQTYTILDTKTKEIVEVLIQPREDCNDHTFSISLSSGYSGYIWANVIWPEFRGEFSYDHSTNANSTTMKLRIDRLDIIKKIENCITANLDVSRADVELAGRYCPRKDGMCPDDNGKALTKEWSVSPLPECNTDFPCKLPLDEPLDITLTIKLLSGSSTTEPELIAGELNINFESVIPSQDNIFAKPEEGSQKYVEGCLVEEFTIQTENDFYPPKIEAIVTYEGDVISPKIGENNQTIDDLTCPDDDLLVEEVPISFGHQMVLKSREQSITGEGVYTFQVFRYLLEECEYGGGLTFTWSPNENEFLLPRQVDCSIDFENDKINCN